MHSSDESSLFLIGCQERHLSIVWFGVLNVGGGGVLMSNLVVFNHEAWEGIAILSS